MSTALFLMTLLSTEALLQEQCSHSGRKWHDGPMPHRSRSENRAYMEGAILEAGRAQLRDRGAAALSLREIARTIGVASSAVYRYVPSRDALLTRLLVDGYSDLADVVDASVANMEDGSSPAVALQALGCAMRDWALDHPEQWSLLYGSPVPGYRAPAASTQAPALRIVQRLVRIASQTSPAPGPLPRDYESFLQDSASEVAPEQAAWAVRAWCTITGTISTQVFGHLGPEPGHDTSVGRAMLQEAVQHLARELLPRKQRT